MNKEEADRVLDILSTADGGCPACAEELYQQFIEEFPEHAELARTNFKGLFGEVLGG